MKMKMKNREKLSPLFVNLTTLVFHVKINHLSRKILSAAFTKMVVVTE